jgi:hypothetical protein
VVHFRRFSPIKGYAKITNPLFEVTKNDVDFRWVPICEGAFETLKRALMETLILYWPNFNKDFILDVD